MRGGGLWAAIESIQVVDVIFLWVFLLVLIFGTNGNLGWTGAYDRAERGYIIHC